jgi:hypothetical protein
MIQSPDYPARFGHLKHPVNPLRGSAQSHVEARLGPSKGRFNELRCRSTGEDEPQVAIAFGQRHHRTPRRNTYVETNHAFNGEGALLS